MLRCDELSTVRGRRPLYRSLLGGHDCAGRARQPLGTGDVIAIVIIFTMALTAAEKLDSRLDKFVIVSHRGFKLTSDRDAMALATPASRKRPNADITFHVM